MADFTSTSPSSPSLPSSPSPSLPCSSTPPPPPPTSALPVDTPPFYFPGPSSRFNTKHERARSQYNFQRDYTPTAPTLSTADRAHRRVQSSANVPTLKSRMLPPTSHPTPNARRSPMSKHYNYTPNKMSSVAKEQNPVTPARKGSLSRSKLQDSPFSDYYTDDGQSNGTTSDSSYRAPSAETQQLLVRLNKLQTVLMRSSPEDVLSEHDKVLIVGRKIGEVETQLQVLNSQTHSQTRMPLEDSGLFMGEEDSDESPSHEEQVESFERAAEAVLTEPDAEGDEVKDDLLRDAQQVLENVNKANQRLRDLYSDLRANHEKCGIQIDSLELENAKLRSGTTELEFDNSALQSNNDTLKTENDGLKTDLGFNRADLLFLKLRHRALEVEIEALHNGAYRMETYAPEIKEEIQQIKRAKIRASMSRWEDEWISIDQRMREKRVKYGMPDEVGALEEVLEVGQSEKEDEVAQIAQVEESVASVLGEDSAVGMDDDSGSKSSDAMSRAVAVCFNKGTQTDDLAPQQEGFYTSKPTQTSPYQALDSSPTPAEAEENEEDDCAITTSSEDNDDEAFSDASSFSGDTTLQSDADAGADNTEDENDDEDDGKTVTPTSPVKAAWHDLWEGLTNLAGMGEGY